VWPVQPERSVPDTAALHPVLEDGVRVGRERTFEQDAAFGIRQLVDIACKAMSPAINDPYTAVQAIDRLSVLFCALAVQRLGTHVTQGSTGARVIVPGRHFADYLATMAGLIRRYGAGEPTVAAALLRLLANCAVVGDPDPDRLAAIEEQARLVVEDAERRVAQSADLARVYEEAQAVRTAVAGRLRTAG
jgi:uncharacterized membrane protein